MESVSAAATSHSLADALIAEIQQEAATTRKCLERVPADKFTWKPHEKSTEFGKLAVHIAEMFGWAELTMRQAELDFSKMDYKPFEPASTDDLVTFLDKIVADAIDVIKNTSEEEFFKPWSLKNGETTYFTLPKATVMRSFVMNHIVHHRGQLSLYLRLNDIPVPSIYGPSADEGAM